MTDEEIYAAMTELYQEQQRCLRVQRKLMFASVIFFVVGFIPVVINLLVSMRWADRLGSRARFLAEYKYRFILYVPLALPNRRLRWDPWLYEAKHLGDDLTIHILNFYDSSMGYIVRSFLGMALMWMITGAICEITGIKMSELLSFLP